MSPTIVGYIMLGLFAFVLLATFVSFLFGLMKGIYKTTLKTILKFLMVLAFIFLTPSISQYVGNFSFPNPMEPGTNTTILSFIAEKINETNLISPMNGMSLYQTCILLASSVLSFAIFLVGLILIQIFAGLINSIFYHGIFRWFLPVETKAERKERKRRKKELKKTYSAAQSKQALDNESALTGNLLDAEGQAKMEKKVHRKLPLLRLPAGLLGAAQEFIFVLCLLAPVTSLARIAIENKDTVYDALKATGMEETQVDEISDYVKEVENSYIYKILGFKNFDTTIMNQATNVTLNNMSVNFGGLVSSLLDVADPLLKDGTIYYDKAAGVVTVNFSALLSTTSVNTIIQQLISSPMIMSLVPPLIDVALNSVGENVVAVENLDFSNIDWSTELNLVNDIYGTIYDGSIAPMLTGTTIKPSNFCLKTSTMTEEEIQEYVGAFEKLGSLESVKRNLPNIFTSMGKLLESQGLEIFPTDPLAYENVDFSTDLGIIGDVILHFFHYLNLDISAKLNVNTLQEEIFAAMKDEEKRNQIADLICGSSTKKGLLDTSLVGVLSLGDMLESILSAIPSISDYVKEVNIKEILDSLSQTDLKAEFRTMFDIAAIVFKEGTKIDFEHLDEIDLSDQETVDQLVELLDIAKGSKIFTGLYPNVMKAVLFHSEANLSVYLYGLSAYNFNFESENFLDDFRSVILLLPKLMEMQKILSDDNLSVADKLNGFDVETIKQLLVIIVNSDFLNSDMRTGITSTAQKNANIYTLFTNLLAEEPFKSIGFVVPSREQFQDVNWGNGNDGGEINVLCNLIENAKKNADFITNPDMNLSRLDDPHAMAQIIQEGFDSKLLSPSILSIIDNSLNQYMEKLGFKISINEMRNSLWKEDFNSIEDLLIILKEIDLEHLDVNTLNPQYFNALMTILCDLNIVKTSNTYVDRFGYVLYHILKKNDLFNQIGLNEITVDAFNTNNEWKVETEKIEIDGITYTVTKSGEIFKVSTLLEILQKYGLDTFKTNLLPAGFVDDLYHAGILGSKITRTFLASFAQKAILDIQLPEGYDDVLPSFDFSMLTSMSDEEFYQELKMAELLYRLYSEKITVGDVTDSKLNYMFDHLFELKEIIVGQHEDGGNITLFDEFSDLFYALSRSKILTTAKDGINDAPMSLMVRSLIESMHLEDEVTFVDDPNYVSDALRGILNYVTKQEAWEQEANHLIAVVDTLQGYAPEEVSIVEKLDKDTAEVLFKEMNRSSVFHRVPIALCRNALSANNIQSLLVDPGTGEVAHEINYRVHLKTTPEDIAFWDHEYENLIELLLGEGGLKEIIKDGSVDLGSIDFSKFEMNFIYYLGTMEIFKDSRSYILYNIADSYKNPEDEISPADAIFIDAIHAPLGENKKVYRFEELFFNNPKLFVDGALDHDKAMYDLTLFKKVAHTCLSNVVKIKNTTDISSIDINFEEMVNQCYTYENGVFYRSDLASELVAGLLTNLFENANLIGAEQFKQLDFYKDDHVLVNAIEGRAIDGLVDWTTESKRVAAESANNPLNAYSKKEVVESIYSLLGCDPTIITEPTIQSMLQYFYESSMVNENGEEHKLYQSYNAVCSELVRDKILTYTLVKEITGTMPINVSTLMTSKGITFSNFYQVYTDLAEFIL